MHRWSRSYDRERSKATKELFSAAPLSTTLSVGKSRVQICTINPGLFSTGFNHRMYDTLDQWYDPKKNFTNETPIREIQEKFRGDDLEYDPQLMIDRMIEVLPMEHHDFRTVCPDEVIPGCKEYQEKLWDLQV